MNDVQDLAYWIGLAHLPKWRTKKINELIVEILHQRKMSFAEFFQGNTADWEHEFSLTAKEGEDLERARAELPAYAFLAEQLIDEGFELIPLNSAQYSKALKQNLKMQYAPPLLYVKGNIQLLNEPSVAVVGSRKASEVSLEFTKSIARKCSERYEVIVSGFAKGVDKTALDAALEVHGHSIIVLPQGVLTFGSGFRKYYSHIVEGNLLVVSAYHPKTPWSVGLAMGRNVYIYGLADKIYVAESDSKGGTWTGAMDGLRKQRAVYVRQPEADEKNANALLLEQGAIPVSMDGVILDPQSPTLQERRDAAEAELEGRVKKILHGKKLSAVRIKELLSLDMDARHLSRVLSQKDFLTIQKIKGRNHFSLKDGEQRQETLL